MEQGRTRVYFSCYILNNEIELPITLSKTVVDFANQNADVSVDGHVFRRLRQDLSAEATRVNNWIDFDVASIKRFHGHPFTTIQHFSIALATSKSLLSSSVDFRHPTSSYLVCTTLIVSAVSMLFSSMSIKPSSHHLIKHGNDCRALEVLLRTIDRSIYPPSMVPIHFLIA